MNYYDNLATSQNKTENAKYVITAFKDPPPKWAQAQRASQGYMGGQRPPKYESKGKVWAKSRPDHPIGLAPDDVVKHRARNKDDDMGIPGLATGPAKPPGGGEMSKSQKKKAAKKKAAVSSQAITEVDFALDNTHISNEGKKKTQPSQGQSQPAATDPSKRLRNLKKKLRDIEKLEKQIADGELKNPEPEQLEKIKKKEEILAEINELELDGVTVK
ncbi:unnamed protein product, partial [Meganyctiphanes norvegica]